jgi:hypothetical protein
MARTRHRRGGAQAPQRIRLNVTLDAALARRLRAYAGFHGRDLSAVVGEAVRTVLKGFKVSQEVAGAWEPSSTPGPDQGRQDAA